MAINLMDYIPDFLKDLKEYKIIFDVLDKEINQLDKTIKRYQENLYIATSDDFGLSKIEELLQIMPDRSIEDLSFRKLRILNRYRLHFPFTEIWLREQLDFLLGKGNYYLELEHNSYLLKLEFSITSSNLLKEFRETLNIIKPCNLLIKLTELITEEIIIDDEHYIFSPDKVLKFPDLFRDPFVAWGGGIKI